jgi:hypothetical protein
MSKDGDKSLVWVTKASQEPDFQQAQSFNRRKGDVLQQAFNPYKSIMSKHETYTTNKESQGRRSE